LEKTTNRRSDNIRLVLIVVLYNLSFIAGIAYTKADLWITMRHAPAIKIQTIDQPPPIERSKTAEIEQSTPGELASMISFPSPDKTTRTPKSQGMQESVDEWKTVRMRVTAYCPCAKCCGQYADGMTACGHMIEAGDTFVAADKRYAFGTEMMVPGYSQGRTVKVLDRGGAIQGDRIDVFFPSHQKALEWGVKYLDVKVHN
jgi:3D (Asp-Asp-Asp) domain-containing protein